LLEKQPDRRITAK
jgi:hypothetical protein